MARRSCFDCDYCDEKEIKDGKTWCRYYHAYYDPEDGYDCGRFEIKKSSSGGCYLTTACVEYKGLPDDCMELTTLRSFRDGYMAQTENGKKEIDDYYAVAPLIVKAISESEEAASVYEGIYSDVILPCVELIDAGKNEEAYSLYKKMVEELKEKYL